ncbi:hypothetical protein EYF80_052206 [Liparis tanakae]|uniref:Uncharacterized protein n=1 Tax=Liparis tanakae TaxID=230148 RepID=A0A4Z2F8Y1_9TELE|nr:hypothetical protein EYF80_052206 [Liparis tanakae]
MCSSEFLWPPVGVVHLGVGVFPFCRLAGASVSRLVLVPDGGDDGWGCVASRLQRGHGGRIGGHASQSGDNSSEQGDRLVDERSDASTCVVFVVGRLKRVLLLFRLK